MLRVRAKNEHRWALKRAKFYTSTTMDKLNWFSLMPVMVQCQPSARTMQLLTHPPGWDGGEN